MAEAHNLYYNKASTSWSRTPGASTVVADRKVVTTAGTAVALVSSSTPAIWVAVTAETDNTGLIAVGGSTVVAAQATRKGVPLNPGDTITFSTDDLADVYIDSTVNGDGVTFTYGQ